MPDRFLFLLGSTRAGGNTELLARRAAAALPPETETRWLRLADHPLEPFVDVRHQGGGYPVPTGNAALLLEATLWATDLVVAAPTYWYSLPAPVKLYLDHWSAWMRAPGVEFKARMMGNRLWAITVNSDDPGDSEGSEPLVRTLELTAQYMQMRWGGALVGHGSRPGEVERDAAALAAAQRLFRPPPDPE
jgi:multimeric flavodoxin WrbA